MRKQAYLWGIISSIIALFSLFFNLWDSPKTKQFDWSLLISTPSGLFFLLCLIISLKYHFKAKS
ncbi:hypothetical protein L0B53_13130 [Vibrio sp. SS-MA-C1-2]|uniref:hypothetical protein n=1 Tax=Vibrio sp. SS-MA-C1-2 TaxID=2908646 RepID=UPI001F466464|nr:hypothetical protein [Vibrio sp. SS-MA-C1-2]UJF17964.1 hypothetical protein L0B53_13130 [Vibrio sp. SS-MA-C1-2]